MKPFPKAVISVGPVSYTPLNTDEESDDMDMIGRNQALLLGRAAGEAAFAAIGVAGSVMNLFLFLISGGWPPSACPSPWF